MTGLLRAVLGWVLVGWAPGLFVVAGIKGRSELVDWAVAPLVSFGVLMAVALGVDAAGFRVSPVTVLPVALGVPLAVLALRFSGRVPRLPRPGPLRLGVPGRHAVALLVLCGVAVCVWVWATSAGSRVPANDDGTHHGLFATQILLQGSVDPARVVVGDVLGGEPSLTYYPLALHLVAALTAQLVSVPVAVVLNVEAIVAAAVLLPLGTYVLCRHLFPTLPTAALVAALVCLTFPEFPYYVAYWGGLPFIVGVSCVPIALATALDSMSARSSAVRSSAVGGGAILGLVLCGMFALHQSEFLAVIGLALVLGLRLRRTDRALLRHQLRAWAVAAGLVALFVLPQLQQLLSRSGELSAIAPTARMTLLASVSKALTYFVSPTGPQLVLLPAQGSGPLVASALLILSAVIGAIWSVRHRTGRRLLLALGLVLAATFALGVRVPVIDTLAFAWYSRWDRMAINEIVLLPTLCAVGIAAVCAAVERARLPRSHQSAALSSVVLVLVVLGLTPQAAVSAEMVRYAYHEASLSTAGSTAAFDWLRRHIRPGQRVLNDVSDGSGWMWAKAEVPPVFAMANHSISPWGDRTTLLQSAAMIGVNRALTASADKWGVEYCYVGPSVFPRRKHMLSARSLRNARGWRLVFRSGHAQVFQRTH